MKAIRVVLMKPVEGFPTVFYVPTEDQSLVENMMTALGIGACEQIMYYLTEVDLDEKIVWPEDAMSAEEILDR